MLDVPFLLTCQWRSARGGSAAEVELCCTQVLRHLPRRRLVFRAEWGGMAHSVKLFFGPNARRDLRRELDGLRALRGGGLPVPEITAELELAVGGKRPGWGVATRWLADAEQVSECDAPALRQVFTGLGRLHASGALRGDPHLGNYLRDRGGTVYAIDGDGVRKSWWPGNRALSNLGQLLAQLPPAADAQLADACAAYAEGRWRQASSERLYRRVRWHLTRQRRLRTRRYLRKTLRDCTEFHCERVSPRFVACRRGAWQTGMRAFAAQPELLFETGKVIKAGNSATVVRCTVDEQPVVIKRYNVKSVWHGVRRLLHPLPRYRRAWRNGHRMEFLRVPTAKALALVETTISPLNTVAYLVMEDCGDRDLASVVAEEGATTELARRVAGLLRALSNAQLVHGDTKASNFLLVDGDVRLIDLDAMRSGDDSRRDVARFLANWSSMPEARQRFADALQAAGMPL